MDETVLKASEIRYLWKYRGSKNYELKCLKATGNFITSIIFEDVRNRREVSGKLVTSPREGEAYHWPRLQHENLAPLFDVISISEKVSVYMSIVLERSLRDIIHEEEFLQTPNCFQRKKSYAEDVLWGLDYLHGKRLCLMNLNDANVFINSQTDKAVISDFSSLTLSARAMKCNVLVPSPYQAPELNDLSNNFNAVAAEMWACGVMLFQIFTGHALPEACSNGEVQQRIANFHYGVLVEANRGSFITSNAFISLQKFLSMFLCLEPSERCTAKTAAVSSFLQNSRNKTDKRYGKLWGFYDPQTFYSPEEVEFKSKSFCDHPNTISSSNSDVDSHRDNLNIHFPWNKFENLDYVSNKRKNSNRSTFLNSLLSNKQNDQQISHNETFDKQINQANSLNFENTSTERYISEETQTVNQPFENINNASEIIRNYFRYNTNPHINNLKNATHISSLCSSDLPDPINKNDNLPTEEISTTEFKQNEMQNEETAINNDSFINLILSGNCNQKNDIEATNKLSSPLEFPIGDCIGIKNEVKRSETSFINNECSASKSTKITQKIIIETADKFLPLSSLSTGDSIGTLRQETKLDNNEISYNLVSKIQKSESDSDESNRHYESDFEAETANKPIKVSSWIKEEYNQNFPSIKGNTHRIIPNLLIDPRNGKITHFSSYKNRISELRRSQSDSTVNSSVSHSVSTKSDTEINQYQWNLFKRKRESQTTVLSDASNALLVNSPEKKFERTYEKFEKSIIEGGMERFSFFEGSPSFRCSESELNEILQKAENFGMDNSQAENSYSPQNNGLLLSAKSLTCNPIFSVDSNVRQSLLPNKSETYLEERKPYLFTNYKSETCLGIEKRAAMKQTKKIYKAAKSFNGDKIKFDPDMLLSEICLKNKTENIGYTSESNNAGSLATDGYIFNCTKMNSYEYAMVERLDLKSKYEPNGCFLFEGIPRSDGTIENKPILFAAGQNQIVDKEHEKSQGDIKYIKDCSSQFEKNELSNENSSINLGLHTDVKINEMPVDSSSFTEISLNSTHEPDGERKQNKIKKKGRRKKSWLHRLCPGSKVYHDDKDELFTET